MQAISLTQERIARNQSEIAHRNIRDAALEAIGHLSDIGRWGGATPQADAIDISEVRKCIDTIDANVRLLQGAL